MRLVSEAHQLDLRKLSQAGFLSAPVGTVCTSETRWPGTSGSSIVLCRLLKWVSVDRVVMGVLSPPQQEVQLIELEATACNFGGRRLWFRCPNDPDPDNSEELDEDSEVFGDSLPATRRCIGRCLVLYQSAPGDPFLCRNCSRLTYPSRQCHRSYLHEVVKPLFGLLQNPNTTQSDDLRALLDHHNSFQKHRGNSS